MTTRRIDFANALLTGIGGDHSGDSTHVVVAWQMAEGQSAGENDPLASLNEHSAHGEGGTGNRFSFAQIDDALARGVAQLSKGGVYQSIGDAFRAHKPAGDLIAAIQAAGWCGGPHAPCPGYGALIRVNFNRLNDPTTWAREATKVVGSTDITGAPKHYDNSGGITGGDVVNSLPGAGIVKGAVSATEAVGTLASHLLDPDFWKRAGVFALGALLAFFGLVMLGKGVAPNVAAGVKKAAGAAAIV